jgi:putative protein-disulfide isomerase
VLAAGKQCAEQAMIDAIQHAYYLRAMNPSDNNALVTLAAELGLDEKQFSEDLTSPEIQAALEQNFALRRKIDVYSFPSLVLARGDIFLPIDVDYQSYRTSQDAITVALGHSVG